MADERLQVKQFRYASDNLGYLIYGQKSAVAVDGGAVDAILEFIDAKGIQLDYVTQTHTHPDHMGGHQALVAR
ncbi:MAG: MBL fold metallo-hydrolase [Desulfobacterales bacterium]|jgi:hydroxyacylglutathione hydrolase